MNTTSPTDSPNPIAELRALIPEDTLDPRALLTAAARQAERLLILTHVVAAPVPASVITDVPHLHIVHDHMPVPSISYWNGQSWVIALNARGSVPQRRIALAHEFASIIWRPLLEVDRGPERVLGTRLAHQIMDSFALSLLLPSRLVTPAWDHGQRHITDLAAQFEVTEHAVISRLIQLRPWLTDHQRRRADWYDLITANPGHAELLTTWIAGGHLHEATP